MTFVIRCTIMLWLLCVWCISVGFAQKNRIFQHKEIKKILPTHKTIAILPFKVFKEQGGVRSEDSLAYTLREEVRHESENIPLTCMLFWVGKADERCPRMLSWEKTRKILNEINYAPIENIPTDSLKKIAKLLQVDALIVGMANSYEEKYTTNFGKTHFASEDVLTIFVSIYDGATGELLWNNEDSTAYSLKLEERVSLAKNTEILLMRIFDKLPYFTKKKKKNKD